MADTAAESGDYEGQMQCQQKASAHEEQMQGTQSPMDRAAGQFAGQANSQDAPPQRPMPGQPGLDKALNYSYQPDNINEFLAPHDQGKPSFGGPNQGPSPGMVHTQTGTPVGPQTQAGAPLPQDMGPPQVPGMDPMMGQPPPMDPMMQQPPMDPMMMQTPPMTPAPPAMPGMDPMAQQQPPMDPMMAQGPVDPMMGQQPPVDPMMGQQQPPMDPMMQQPPPPSEPGMAPPPTGMDPGGAPPPNGDEGAWTSADDGSVPYEMVEDDPGLMGDDGQGAPEPGATDAPQQEAGADQMNDNGPPKPPSPPKPPGAENGDNGDDKEETKGSPSDVAPFGGNAKDEKADEEGKPQFMKSLKDWRRRNA